MKTKPTGLAKIWREVKRLFGRKTSCYDKFRSKLFIRDDGRVNIGNVSIDIVLGCNLRCANCDHLSPYRKGFVPTEKLVHWFEVWSKKIHADEIRLAGGEPFLHPDLASVILESSRVWNDSVLKIVTNGLLVRQTSQDVFNAIKKANVEVIVSDHSGLGVPHEKVAAGCARLKKNDISYNLRLSNKRWRVMHQQNEEGLPVSFQSSPHNAFTTCVPKQCPALANNRLYKCTVLASVIEGTRDGSFPSTHWKDALTYNPLTPDADASTILEHFRTFSVAECCICPEKIVYTEATQLPASHKRIA